MPPFVPLWKETRGFPSSWFVYREVIAAAERGHGGHAKKKYVSEIHPSIAARGE